jgi:hypothetical protein
MEFANTDEVGSKTRPLQKKLGLVVSEGGRCSLPP